MVYLILAMLFYSVSILFSTAANRHANTNVTAAIMNAISAIIPIVVIIPLVAKKNLQSEKFGLVMAVLTGIMIALFVMAINKAYALNKVGIVTPVVFGGAIFLSTTASYFIFKEKTTPLQSIGLVLVGLGLIAIIYARATAK